ncbi:hypothetical protein [Streptomyces massasporeus]|uniref:hypothetical protein n=1 Tax=Streptomyces massasporeus TaxID=67324 RepID=UPI0033297058
MIYHAAYWHYVNQRATGPVAAADRVTSLADARAAMCLASGVDIDDIDPASGYDISRRAYESSRRSWVDAMRYDGLSYFYVRPHLEKVVARWARRRPEFIVGDDWAAAGMSAHLDYWRERGGRCRMDDCLIHDAGRLRFEAGYERGDAAGEQVAAWTVGEAHATLSGPDGREVDSVAIPAGADEATALSAIMDRWGENLARWDRIAQEPERQPAADETRQGGPADAPPAPQDTSDRLF